MECALEIELFQLNGLAELDLNLSRQQVTDQAQILSGDAMQCNSFTYYTTSVRV